MFGCIAFLREGWCLNDQMQKARHAATWQALRARCALLGTGFYFFCMSGFPAFHAWPTFSPET